MGRNLLVVSAFLGLIPATMGYSADIYVAPNGNDNADGSLGAPLATLAAARDKANTLKVNNTPVNVFFKGGTYYMSAPVEFGPQHSGTATAPIIYKAYQCEKAILSGGIKVTSAWTASTKPNIMVTKLATNLKVDQLFLNGSRQILARHPNFNPTQKLQGSNGTCFNAARVALWADPAEGPGYIRALHDGQWGGNSFKITAKTGTTITYQWVGDNNRGSAMHTSYRMVENIYEELDTVGEWFYRKSTGDLFYWPPAGTNLNTSTIELASQDELIRIVGATPANSVKYLQFKGITFTHTYRTLFSKPYELIFKSDWGVARAGAMFIQNAENLRIENCAFDQVGGNGIFVSGYNRNHVIYNNLFTATGASCIAIMGVRSSVRCPNAWDNTAGTCTDWTPGPVDPVNGEFPAYITVDNNMMSVHGVFEKQPAGIALSATQCDTLRHNTIHDMPRAGICFLDGSWGGHIVEYNWVYKSVQETGDHGPFNAWGRDRISRRSNDTAAAKLDAWKTTVVRNNRFEAPNQYFGIDLDDQACNYLQYNNLLFGGGLKLQWNMFNTYVNNILVSGASAQFHAIWSKSQHYGARNIIVGSYIYQFFNAGTSTTPELVKSSIKQWDSNCVYNNGNKPYVAPWHGTNSVYTWDQWLAAGLDNNSKLADPMFTDTNKTWPGYLPKGDYTVKPGSPALTLGFKNFPMDSFGVMGIAGPANCSVGVNGPSAGNGVAVQSSGIISIRCNSGKLTVSCNENYRVTVTSILGRTIQSVRGTGRSSTEINTKSYGPGTYFAVVGTNNMTRTLRFIVN